MGIPLLSSLDEGYVVGLITALKFEDPLRYCETLELRSRIEEILKVDGWNTEKIEYWLDWLKEFLQ